MDSASLGPTCVPILQIHPSRFCNLACRHCYSSSAPVARDALPPTLVADLILDAAAQGYRAVSISGGEPFLYAGLPAILRTAKECGMHTMVATNGYYLNSNKYRKCRDDIDIIALSIDGAADAHNEMRGRKDAFATIRKGAAILRAEGMPFAFIHTVHDRNWFEIDQIADIAEAAGAQFLQLHPLEVAGRAAQEMKTYSLSRANARRLFVAVHALMVERRDLRVHLDLLHRDWVAANPALTYAPTTATSESLPLAKQLSVIVLDESGNLLPATYGLNRRYSIANLNNGRLRDSVAAYLAGNYSEFISLCRSVHEMLRRDIDCDLFNWSEILALKSNSIRTISIHPERSLRSSHANSLPKRSLDTFSG